MSNVIKNVRIREDRAKLLKNKALELTIKKEDYIRESDIINYLIDDCLEKIDIDIHGIYLNTEKEELTE